MSSLKKQINSLLDHKFWKKGENICTQYFKACELCDEIYNKGMVLMQVGSFFEAYGVNNKYIQRGHANLIGDIFNIAVTRKGKKKYAEELGNRKIEDLTEKQLINLHEKYPLMSGMNELVLEKYLRIAIDNGYTVVVIEHNLDVIKTADYIVDMGPEGGVKGGKIIAEGKPEEICKINDSYTGKFLMPFLN